MSRVHVVGAGLAGLSAALAGVRAGFAVTLYEAAPQAGGRCRSWHDERLGCTIDNGGHVVMSANDATLAFLDLVGGRAHMVEVAPAAYPFLDLASGARWSVRPNPGPLPWWVLAPSRRPPGMRAGDALRALALLRADADASVADFVAPGSRLAEAFWEPLAVAVMNAPLAEAAARPLASAMRATFLRGERFCRPLVARAGLSRAFAEPALAFLAAHGSTFLPDRRLTRIGFAGERATELAFSEATVALEAGDRVVLAVPSWIAKGLLDTAVPEGANAIVNAHYRLPHAAALPGGAPLLGLVGGTAQWLIAHDDVVSVTVSAADAIVDRPADALGALLWRDVARAIGADPAAPAPHRVIKEKRATFAQTPANQRRRPGPRTRWHNLCLAGDWTATGLPATIESAIRSGREAVAALGAP